MYDNCSYKSDSKRIIVAPSFFPETLLSSLLIQKHLYWRLCWLIRGKNISFIIYLDDYMQQLSTPSMVKGREKVKAGNESRNIWRKSLKSAKKKKSFLAFPPNLYTAGSSKAPLNINLLKSFSDHFKPGECVTFPCMIGSEVTRCNKIISTKSSTYIWFSYWGDFSLGEVNKHLFTPIKAWQRYYRNGSVRV